MTVHALPSLDTLVAHPEQIAELSVPVCQTALIQIAQLQGLLLSRMLVVSAPTSTPSVPTEKYLTVEEVVTRFGVSKAWLYRHKQHLPHSQPSRKTLLFPEKAVSRWFATRTP